MNLYQDLFDQLIHSKLRSDELDVTQNRTIKTDDLFSVKDFHKRMRENLYIIFQHNVSNINVYTPTHWLNWIRFT